MPISKNYNQPDDQLYQLGGVPLIISIILKKYNLKELDEDFIDSEEENLFSSGGILLDITIEVIEGKISKKELVSVLETHLKIPKATAEKLAKDIEETLIPEVKKELEEAKKRRFAPPEKEKPTISEMEEKPIAAAPIKPPIGLEKTMEKETIEPVLKIPPRIKKPPISEKPEKTKEIETKKPPKKPDVYREPIE